MMHASEVAKTLRARELGVSRGTLYYKPKKPDKDWLLKCRIEEVLREHHSYGSRRVALHLRMNRKRVKRVMNVFGIKPYRRRGRKWKKTKNIRVKYANLLLTNYPLYENHIWATDFTYLPFQGRFVYVATVIDLYTRKVVGLSVYTTHAVQLTLTAFLSAIHSSPRCITSDTYCTPSWRRNMRITSINRGVKGSRTTQEYAIRFAYMISEEAKRRARIISFWKRHGLEATEEAYGVRKRTLYLWQHKLKEGEGKLESLNCGSRAPKKKRQRRYDWRIVDEIKRLRLAYPNLGEKKLYPLLFELCAPLHLACPKQATIGRIIKDKGGMRTAPLRTTGKGKVLPWKRRKVLRKPHDLAATHPGHVVALDTIERFVHGLRRYVITCEDIHSRFTFAWGTTSHASKAAEEFFEHWSAVFPCQTTFVLTDNGSEFKKHFADRLLELQITHYHTYPRTPKMNAHVERFNRTIQDEFIDYHDALLLDLPRFNEKLMDWLLFYNTKRVHHAFKNELSPVQYLLQYESLAAECKTTCGHTCYCVFWRAGAYSSGSMTAEETAKKARKPRAKTAKSADGSSVASTPRAKKSDAAHRLRIKVRAYEHGILDKSVKQIIDTAARYNATIVGPVPLPIDIKKYTVNRAAFIDKDSREQFEMRIHKRMIDILNPDPKVIEALTNIDLPSGVSIDVKMM